MPGRPTTSAIEVTFARALLKYLHANMNNVYLLLAVIAWVRQESGSNYIGNNPLNLRPYADDEPYRSGMRRAGSNGFFSVYASLDKAAQASANRLTLLQGSGFGYDRVIRAAQRGTSGSVEDSQRQALDFLAALALSSWDAGHYGTTGKAATYTVQSNHLFWVWQGLLGAPVVIPPDDSDKPTDSTPKPPPAPPKPQPRHEYVNAVAPRDYLLPYATLEWYERRRKAPEALPGDPASTGIDE